MFARSYLNVANTIFGLRCKRISTGVVSPYGSIGDRDLWIRTVGSELPDME